MLSLLCCRWKKMSLMLMMIETVTYVESKWLNLLPWYVHVDTRPLWVLECINTRWTYSLWTSKYITCISYLYIRVCIYSCHLSLFHLLSLRALSLLNKFSREIKALLLILLNQVIANRSLLINVYMIYYILF